MSGNPPRLITSKPGFNASTSLADVNKTFDSNWFNGCAIKWRINWDIPANTTGIKMLFPYVLSYMPVIAISNRVVYSSPPSIIFYSGIPWSVPPSGVGRLVNGNSTNPDFNVSYDGITYIGEAFNAVFQFNILIFEA